MTSVDLPVSRTRPAQGGPPLVVLAAVALLLLILSLVLSAALGGSYPSPFGDPALITAFFVDHKAATLASGVFQFATAVPLAVYAATASSRLRTLGVTAPGATIALVGGAVSAAMLALSGLLTWVLSRPEVTEPAVVRPLHDLAFATGGVGHIVFLGLLIAGIAVPALILGLLPRPLAIAGLVIASLAELSTLSLVWSPLAYLLPVARFPGMLFLVVAGYLLPRRAAGVDR